MSTSPRLTKAQAQAVAKALMDLRTLRTSDDVEAVHLKADRILCEMLSKLGFDEIVKAYGLLPKWYG